jgi:hypothetical protein
VQLADRPLALQQVREDAEPAWVGDPFESQGQPAELGRPERAPFGAMGCGMDSAPILFC